MKVLIHLQAFCIALFVLHTGADITLTAVTPLNSMLINGLRVRVGFECGFRVTFVCEVKPYTIRNTVVWQVNSKTYALCLFQNCFNYPPYPAYHGISMSLATETFNLTTDPITLAARRSIYSCNDGVTALSVDAIVKVYVNNETLKMDTSKTNQITLTTGCVYPYGRDDMSFKWFISKDRMILQQSPFVRDDIQSIQPFACVETSDCAGAESVRFNSTITVAVDIFDTGEDYYICAAVQHIDAPDRPRAVHCSVRTYKIRNYITDGSPRTFAFWKILLIILVIYRILFLLQYSLFLCENGTQNDWFCGLVGCFVPGLRLLLLIFKQDVDVCCCRLNKCFKVLSFVIIVTEIVTIIVFIVLEKQLRIYIISAAVYICVSWVLTATILSCMYDRQRCTGCGKNKTSAFICKSCKLNYCEDCGNRDPQMICVCFKCTICDQKSDLICTSCYKQYCEHCMRQDKCKADQQMTCGECERARTEMKSYCCKCKKFLCNSCSIKHIKCKGILLKHPQLGTGREDEIFCETKKHASIYSAHGYCLTCDRYLCTACLGSSHLKHELLWIQYHYDAVKDRLCCSRDHTGSYQGFCLKCKLYICLNCSEKHRGDKHHLVMHTPEVSLNDCHGDIKYCANHATSRAECYSYTEYAYLCAYCFEQGRRPKKREKADVWKNKDNCCLHEYFIDDQMLNSNSDAFCLICKICLCRTCYKLHRRFTEHWIKTHEKNTYFCKQCKKKGMLFPVECYDLDSSALSCAECFEGKAITEMRTSRYSNTLVGDYCQIHEFPFLVKTTKVKSNVYCFICKVYMCKQCFRKHRRLDCVLEKNEHLKQLKRSRGLKRTATRSNLKMCALIPVAGLVYGLFQCCTRTKETRNNNIWAVSEWAHNVDWHRIEMTDLPKIDV